jgi:hypothetical protein
MTRWLATVLAVSLLGGCSPDSREDDDDQGGGGFDAGGVDAGTADASPFVDATPLDDGSTPPFEDGVIYAHSPDRLYQIDPDSYEVTEVGPFVWPADIGFDQMTDIAIDKTGTMIGVSFTRVYRVDPLTAGATYLAPLARSFNGLSFIADALPENPEILIGSSGDDGTVWKIDPATGATTQIGEYGNGFYSSGDIVSIEGFGTVATVKGGSSPGNGDWLAKLDPVTFNATVIGSGTGFSDIWGLGFWKGKVFGFSDASKMLLIDPTSGVATELSTSSFAWWGAGVTTTAPIIP